MLETLTISKRIITRDNLSLSLSLPSPAARHSVSTVPDAGQGPPNPRPPHRIRPSSPPQIRPRLPKFLPAAGLCGARRRRAGASRSLLWLLFLMAYRRKHGTPRSSTFEDFRSTAADDSPTAPSLAAQAIRASSAFRDSTLSSAYGESAIASAYRDTDRQRSPPAARDSPAYEYTSMKSLSESKSEGFWGVLARKAKSILEDDNAIQQDKASHQNLPQMLNTPSSAQFHQSYQSPESHRRADNPAIQKRLGALTSSLNYIGGTIGNALEEGLTIVEHRTADIIQETKRLNIKRKGGGSNVQNNGANPSGLPQMQTDQETQLKASRDVANAMAAKAKLLLRELKTVKADLAFAKERCAQLEEENKVLREGREKGDHPEDDDLIRLQLETLLAEKARLANENSIYARENRFLREIVEYHQLTMQDVVYLDEGIEEVTEVYQNQIPIVSSRAAGESQFSILDSPASMSEPTALPIPVPPSSVLHSSALHALPSFELEDCPVVPNPASPATTGVEAHLPQVKAGEDLKRHTSLTRSV